MKGKKTGGRQKGSKNRVRPEMRDTLKAFLEDRMPAMFKAFDKLKPRDKVFAWTKLAPFVTPQFATIQTDINKMPTEWLDAIISRIKEQQHHESKTRENEKD